MEPASIRVLLVEDNPLHARLLEGFLRRIPGTRIPVVLETTVDDALQRAGTDEFDVVLLDLVLPDSRGLDTLLRFRARFPDLPVVVLTGLDDMDLATRALGQGARDYLLKNQVNAPLLHRSLRYALERGQVDQEPWVSPSLRVAHQQFLTAAQACDLPDHLRRQWISPRRIQQLCLLDREGQPTVAYRVHHLSGNGVTFGGVRSHPTVTRGEVIALAMRGSWQAALLGIPFGGAFGGVRVAPGTADDESLGLLRLYLEELASPPGHVDLIGPGLGSTSAHEILLNDPDLGPCSPLLADVPAWATAAGLGALLDAVAPDADVDLPGASVVIQGFGVLGRCVAASLHHRGLRILVVSDEHGGILNTDGLDIDALLSHVKNGHPLRRFPDATSLTNEELLRFPCDLLIPAAIANQITPENAAQLQCSLIAEMACGAVTIEADEILRERGIGILPAILANAGGVIYSYLRQTSPEMDRHEITKSISKRVLKALSEAQSLAAAADLDLRSAATTCALKALQESA